MKHTGKVGASRLLEVFRRAATGRWAAFPRHFGGQGSRRFSEIDVLIAAAALFLAGPTPSAFGQASLLVDIKTVSTVGIGINESPLLERLFLPNGDSLPLGTPIWFVADLGNNGLNLESLGRSDVLPNEIFGADDIVVLRDAVNGDQPGSRSGVFRRVGISLDIPAGQTAENVLRANIYALIWNTPSVIATPVVGTQFGILNLGVKPKPDFGNPFWAISQSFSTEPFVVVPEPTAALAGGCALVAWAGWRWLRRRAVR